MSFLSNFLLKKQATLSSLPSVIKKCTQNVIDESKGVISQTLTKGSNWHFPDAKFTMSQIDHVSNECCKIIDSSLILYKNFSDENKPLQEALVNSMNEVNDFFGSEYLNLNRRLLTLLIQI